MYGLPFRTSEYDIAKWFLEVKAKCIDVQIHLNPQGKRSGDATAFFKTMEEAEHAMERNKADMAGRYINLKLDTAAATFDLGMYTKVVDFYLFRGIILRRVP